MCRLRKELYGLNQSPRAWFDKFTIVARSSAEVKLRIMTISGILLLKIVLEDLKID